MYASEPCGFSKLSPSVPGISNASVAYQSLGVCKKPLVANSRKREYSLLSMWGVPMKFFYLGFFCLVIVALPSLAVAQDGSSAASNDHQVIQQLLQKVHQLETRLQEVEGREHTTPAPASAAAAPRANPHVTETHEDAPGMVHVPEQSPHIRGYADVGFFATPGADNTPNSHSTFALGQFNLFMTSRISPRAGVLAELVVEPDPSNGVGVDLERLLFSYSVQRQPQLLSGPLSLFDWLLQHGFSSQRVDANHCGSPVYV